MMKLIQNSIILLKNSNEFNKNYINTFKEYEYISNEKKNDIKKEIQNLNNQLNDIFGRNELLDYNISEYEVEYNQLKEENCNLKEVIKKLNDENENLSIKNTNSINKLNEFKQKLILLNENVYFNILVKTITKSKV